MTLDDIRRFRQLDSKAPGTSRVPLGLGRRDDHRPARAGRRHERRAWPIAEKWLADRYNRPGFDVFDYDIYAVCGDGCMMEGVALGSGVPGRPPRPRQPLLGLRQQPHHHRGQHRASPSPRTSRRGSSATGGTSCGSATPTTSSGSSTPSRCSARRKGRPTFIILDSHIGYGSPHKQDTPEAHGEPLGDDEIRLTKRAYGWPEDAQFLVPDGVCEHFAAGIGARGAEAAAKWTSSSPRTGSSIPELATEIDQMQRRELPAGLGQQPARSSRPDPKGVAGREASGKVLNVLAQNIPWLLGGSADLGPSNKTTADLRGRGRLPGRQPGRQEPPLRHPRARDGGDRERAVALKLRPFGATFFIFSDYARPAIRLSALMELPAIFVFTHDAMGDGEDGPTHQPVEHLASLRAIPGLVTLRPGDANEVVEAYRYVMQLRHEPAVLALSRQPLPTLDRSKYAPASGVARGAYVLGRRPRRETRGDPHRHRQRGQPRRARPTRSWSPRASAQRVVSMPSWDIFEHQTSEYRGGVLPPAVLKARVWPSGAGVDLRLGAVRRAVGPRHRHEDLRGLGPLKELREKFRVPSGQVVAAAKAQLREEVGRGRRAAAPREDSLYRSARTLRAGDLDAVFLPGCIQRLARDRGTEI